jgi:hypothetical protein
LRFSSLALASASARALASRTQLYLVGGPLHLGSRLFGQINPYPLFGILRALVHKIASMAATVEILTAKDAIAKRAIGECEAALAAAVKSVIAEEVSPLLCRMQDCENAAATLRSELRALQNSGRWGLCPQSLPVRLAREPANVFHADRPLPWDQQKAFDRRKAAWRDFADRLREDAGAILSLGD